MCDYMYLTVTILQVNLETWNRKTRSKRNVPRRLIFIFLNLIVMFSYDGVPTLFC